MSSVVIRRTRGRTPTRGKSCARPLSSGMEIINICRGRFGAILAHIVAPAERTVGARTSHNRVGFTLGGGSLNHDPKPVRNSFSGLSRFQACKQSSRGIGQCFQELILSAQAMILAAGVYGQHLGRREMKCPTKSLKDPTK